MKAIKGVILLYVASFALMAGLKLSVMPDVVVDWRSSFGMFMALIVAMLVIVAAIKAASD